MASMAMAATMSMAAAPVLFAAKVTASNLDCTIGCTEGRLLEHMPMVRAVARKLHRGLPQHVELDDLISAGVVGLLDAMQKYEAGRDVQFGSYAQFRVRGAILDSLREQDWAPRELRRSGRDIEQAIAACATRLGRTPDEDEIATELAMSVDELRSTLGDLRSVEMGSLQVEKGEDSDEEEIAYVADPTEPGALFHCIKGELRQHLMEAIEALPERERLVITLSYYEELTMKEIAKVLVVSEGRVSQMRAAAVLKLRAALASCV